MYKKQNINKINQALLVIKQKKIKKPVKTQIATASFFSLLPKTDSYKDQHHQIKQELASMYKKLSFLNFTIQEIKDITFKY